MWPSQGGIIGQVITRQGRRAGRPGPGEYGEGLAQAGEQHQSQGRCKNGQEPRGMMQ